MRKNQLATFYLVNLKSQPNGMIYELPAPSAQKRREGRNCPRPHFGRSENLGSSDFCLPEKGHDLWHFGIYHDINICKRIREKVFAWDVGVFRNIEAFNKILSRLDYYVV